MTMTILWEIRKMDTTRFHGLLKLRSVINKGCIAICCRVVYTNSEDITSVISMVIILLYFHIMDSYWCSCLFAEWASPDWYVLESSKSSIEIPLWQVPTLQAPFLSIIMLVGKYFYGAGLALGASGLPRQLLWVGPVPETKLVNNDSNHCSQQICASTWRCSNCCMFYLGLCGFDGTCWKWESPLHNTHSLGMMSLLHRLPQPNSNWTVKPSVRVRGRRVSAMHYGFYGDERAGRNRRTQTLDSSWFASWRLLII